MTLKIFLKVAENEVKKMKFVRLTIFMTHSLHIINMYSNIKYKKVSATVYEIFNKIKTGSSEMSIVSSEHP